MQDISEEEAEALDEYYTAHTPKIDTGKPGVTKRQGFRLVALDDLSSDYLYAKSLAEHKTPTQLIGELVRQAIGKTATL